MSVFCARPQTPKGWFLPRRTWGDGLQQLPGELSLLTLPPHWRQTQGLSDLAGPLPSATVPPHTLGCGSSCQPLGMQRGDGDGTHPAKAFSLLPFEPQEYRACSTPVLLSWGGNGVRMVSTLPRSSQSNGEPRNKQATIIYVVLWEGPLLSLKVGERVPKEQYLPPACRACRGACTDRGSTGK